VKASYRQAAKDDVVRQFRYYLVTLSVPEVAIRFRSAVQSTVQSLLQRRFVGPHYRLSNPRLQDLRSWPVAGLKPSGFTTSWLKTPSTSFGFCTASAMLSASSKVSRVSEE